MEIERVFKIKAITLRVIFVFLFRFVEKKKLTNKCKKLKQKYCIKNNRDNSVNQPIEIENRPGSVASNFITLYSLDVHAFFFLFPSKSRLLTPCIEQSKNTHQQNIFSLWKMQWASGVTQSVDDMQIRLYGVYIV